MLRVQTPGPISQLGPTPPPGQVGAHTRSLVFLARGPAPYRLAWGNPRPDQAAMSLAQLLPARQPGDTLPPDLATLVARLQRGLRRHRHRPQAPAAAAAPANKLCCGPRCSRAAADGLHGVVAASRQGDTPIKKARRSGLSMRGLALSAFGDGHEASRPRPSSIIA
jgi:hypothetical protein